MTLSFRERWAELRYHWWFWTRCHSIVSAVRDGEGMHAWVCQRTRWHPGSCRPHRRVHTDPHRIDPPRGGLP